MNKALKECRRHAARSSDDPTAICLIGQARGGHDYVAQRRHWLRKARGWSAETWAERLPQGQYAIFVAPVAPETAARAREHPKPFAVPIFIEFDLALPPESALAIAVSVWLTKVAVRDFDAVALTPPVLERYGGGRLIGREVCHYGLQWPLPPPPLS